MNHHPVPSIRQIFPTTIAFRQDCRWLRVRRLTVAAVIGLLLMGAARVQAESPRNRTGPAIKSSTVVSNGFDVLDDQYKLVLGDQLSFRILEDKEVFGKADPVNLVVTDSGDVQVPYIGRYPAVGKTCKELALILKTQLEKDCYKRATVILAVDSKPRSRGKIYLVGAIGAPGPQDIPSDETLTLSKAILRAGGLTPFAKGSAVQITRSTGPDPGDETKIIVDVTRILDRHANIQDDVVLQPGDLIFVPERMIRL